MTISNNTDIFIPPTYMVDPVLGAGTHTTIQAAINDANTKFLATGVTVTVYIRDGQYTENLTVKAGVNFVGGGNGAQVIGHHTWAGAGVRPYFDNISFQCSDGNPMFTSPIGGGGIGGKWENCNFSVSGNSPLFLFQSNGEFNWIFQDCLIFINNAGAESGLIIAGSVLFKNCVVFSTSANTDWLKADTDGGIQILASFFNCGLQIAGNASFDVSSSLLFTNGTTNGLITSNTTRVNIFYCFIRSGAIAIQSNNTSHVETYKCNISSSTNVAIQINNTSDVLAEDLFISQAAIVPSIDGTGTVAYDHIGFNSGIASTFGAGLTVSVLNTRPYSTAAANNTLTTRGHCSFDSAFFSVDTEGFVSASGTGLGQTIAGNTGGPLSPTAGNWNIYGASGSYTSGTGSTLTVLSPPYSDQAAPVSVLANSGSFSGAITLTLPVSAGLVDGDLCEFVATGSPLVIQAAAGQTIRIGSLTSSVAGTATSTLVGDSVSLRWQASSSTWWATSVIGTWLMA